VFAIAGRQAGSTNGCSALSPFAAILLAVALCAAQSTDTQADGRARHAVLMLSVWDRQKTKIFSLNTRLHVDQRRETLEPVS